MRRATSSVHQKKLQMGPTPHCVYGDWEKIPGKAKLCFILSAHRPRAQRIPDLIYPTKLDSVLEGKSGLVFSFVAKSTLHKGVSNVGNVGPEAKQPQGF